MGLAEAGGGYADKLCVRLQLDNVFAASIAHARTEAPYKLCNHLGDRPLVGDTTFDPFGDVFGIANDAFLRIAVAGALSHCADRSHAAVGLEVSALEQDDFPGSFFRTRKKRSDHHA